MSEIIIGDSLTKLKTLPSESVHCIITSPPYWGLRDYGIKGQLGREKTPKEFIQKIVAIFREAHRVLRNDGTLWVNIGDSYAYAGGPRGNSKEERATGHGNFKVTASSLRDRGTSSSHSVKNLKPKDLVGIPWMLAFALRADGWYLRQDIIWHKPNPMPESVKDRCTKSHEYVFLLAKSERYYYDAPAISEPAIYGSAGRKRRARKDQKTFPTSERNGMRSNGAAQEASITGSDQQASVSMPERRNKRDVWSITTQPFKDAHFATFPEKLIEPMILAGCPVGGIVLDPFMGAGTTAVVARKLGREYIGIEINPAYVKLARERIGNHKAFGASPVRVPAFLPFRRDQRLIRQQLQHVLDEVGGDVRRRKRQRAGGRTL